MKPMNLQRAITAKKHFFFSSSSSLAHAANLLLPRSPHSARLLFPLHHQLRRTCRLSTTKTQNTLPNSFKRHEHVESEQLDGRFEETQSGILLQPPIFDESTKEKVKELIGSLKKFPNGDGGPLHVSRNTDLPRKWDGPFGTILLVNKPKGNISHSHRQIICFSSTSFRSSH